MKKWLSALCLVTAIALTAAVPAAFAEDKINALNSKSDWSVFEENRSLFSLTEKVMSITPTDTDAGATYIAASYQDLVMEFDYQIAYDESVDPYDESDPLLPASFWGILFANQVTVDENWTGNSSLPWIGRGGYPYMLCFDSERQTTDASSGRYTQVGLSVRRYSEEGGHSYPARWSTVDPGTFDYLTSESRYAHSFAPKFSKPVTVSDCFDETKHSVKVESKSLYKANGDESDATSINVWFDGELVLTVLDEMPVESEVWGVTQMIDKRGEQGYIGVFAHHSGVSDPALYDWKVDISEFYLTGSASKTPEPPERGGCGSKNSASLTVLAALAICAGKRFI